MVGGVDGAGAPAAGWKVDGVGEVFEDEGFEAEAGGREGGEADAEVVGEAAEEEAPQAAFASVKTSASTPESQLEIAAVAP